MKVYSIFIIILTAFTFFLAGYKTYVAITHPIKFKEEIMLVSKKYNLDDELIASLINVESSYRENAKSNKNAIGLMQIKLETANYLNEIENKEEIKESDLFKTSINIEYGCKYLRYLINKFENINTSLAAYNAGETRVRSWLKSSNYSSDGKTLKSIPYKETENYVEKINKNIKFYKKIY